MSDEIQRSVAASFLQGVLELNDVQPVPTLYRSQQLRKDDWKSYSELNAGDGDFRTAGRLCKKGPVNNCSESFSPPEFQRSQPSPPRSKRTQSTRSSVTAVAGRAHRCSAAGSGQSDSGPSPHSDSCGEDSPLSDYLSSNDQPHDLVSEDLTVNAAIARQGAIAGQLLQPAGKSEPDQVTNLTSHLPNASPKIEEFCPPKFIIDSQKENYLCTIKRCMSVLWPLAWQAHCGHRFCNACRGRMEGGHCPRDNENIMTGRIFKDFACLEEMRAYEFGCGYSGYLGCTWKGHLDSYEAHHADCRQTVVPCPKVVIGCTKRLRRCEMHYHLNWECRHSFSTCFMCNQSCIAHELKNHMKTCANTGRAVELMPAGQPQQFPGISFHKDEQLVLELASRLSVEQLCAALMHKLRQESSQQHIQDIGLQLQQLASGKQSRWLSSQQASATYSVNDHSADARVLPSNQQQEHIVGQHIMLSTAPALNVLTLSPRRPILPTGSGQPTAMLNERQPAGMHTYQETEAMRADMSQYMPQSTSYNGILLWPVLHYSKVFENAAAGEEPCLHGPQFYSSCHGDSYTVYPSVYPNGEGIGKGSHLSVGLVVERNDGSNLPWPFCQKVTLMLIDQSVEQQHMSKILFPDPHLSSTSSPWRAIIKSLCFISHATLKARNFLKDDSIVIKVEVDQTSLPVL